MEGVRLLVFGGPAPGFAAFLEHVRGRLPLVPRLRQRVRRDVLELRRPRWQPDPAFDIGRHVRPMALPTANSRSQLEALCEALLRDQIDLRRPLWELLYVEGLPAGRFAVGARFHHALADGAAVSHVLTQLFPPLYEADVRPVLAPARRAARTYDREPSARGVGRTRTLLAPARFRPFRRRIRRGIRRLWLPVTLARRRPPAPETPLNRGSDSLHRSVRLLSMPLDDLRRAQTGLEATINSLLVAAIAGGLRRYMLRLGWPAINLVALVAVSVRERDDLRLGNHAKTVACELPVGEPDASERLRLVSDSLPPSISAKRASARVDGGAVGPQLWRDHLTRRRYGERRCNLIISNTMHQTVPLRCCERQAELVVPSGPGSDFHGPLIRIGGYLDSITISITADPARLPAAEELAADIRASVDELLAMVSGSVGGTSERSPDGWIGSPW